MGLHDQNSKKKDVKPVKIVIDQEIVLRNVEELLEYPHNAKKHPEWQVVKISDSIREFGFKQPIVLDKEDAVIVGHGRLRAAQLLGMKKVPCIIAKDLTPDQVKAYRLADNKLNESDWDMDLVTEELKDLPECMIDLTGFDEDLVIEEEDVEIAKKEKKLTECPNCGEEF